MVGACGGLNSFQSAFFTKGDTVRQFFASLGVDLLEIGEELPDGVA